MTLTDVLSNAMSTIINNEKRHKHECIVWPASKVVGRVLRVMQKNGYIGEFEFVDDGRTGKFKVQLLGRVNGCGVIKPRYSVRRVNLEFWEKRYLPSREVGILVISSPNGILSHKEAREERTGGKLLAYVY